MYTDSSGYSVGYLIGQTVDEGKDYVCEYGGRSLRKHEKAYRITELERLALVEGVSKYRVYLSNKPFIVFVDHQALTFLDHLKGTSGRLQRWSMFLNQFAY